MAECIYCGLPAEEGEKFCSIECGRGYSRVNKTERKLGFCKNCDKSIIKRRIYCAECFAKKREAPVNKKHLTRSTICLDCRAEKTPENSKVTADGFYQKRCRKCNAEYKLSCGRKLKQKLVDYKGGECEVCGYNKEIACLQFHHIDPAKKDFHLGEKHAHAFSKVITDELDKCAMLCANCHMEEHIRLKRGLPSLLILPKEELNIQVNLPEDITNQIHEKFKSVTTEYLDEQFTKVMKKLFLAEESQG